VRAQVLPKRLQVILPDRLVDAEWWENDVSAGPDRGAEREAELTRRRPLGEFAYLEAANKRVEDLAKDSWEIYAKPNLAYNTLAGYAPALDKYVLPRLGRLKLREVTPVVLARFRADLEKIGLGRSNVRISLVVVQAMFSRAQEWGWVSSNPAKAVRKPPASGSALSSASSRPGSRPSAT
jgi:hypothetical protein